MAGSFHTTSSTESPADDELNVFEQIGKQIVVLKREIAVLEHSPWSREDEIKLRDLRQRLMMLRKRMKVAESERPRLPGF